MKFNNRLTSRIRNKTILLGVISALMISIIPMAAADPIPGVSSSPSIPVVGGSTTITIAPVLYPVTSMKVVMFESGRATEAFPAFISPAPCLPPIGATAPLGLNKWLLTRAGVPAEISATSGTVLITYGSGAAPTVSFSGAGSVIPAAGVFAWTDEIVGNGIQPDNFGLLTGAFPYSLGICGYEGPSTPFPLPFGGFSSIFTQLAVAGEIIPIDTTALLIAGMSANSMLVLPILGVVAGAAFTLLRFQVHRK